MNESVRSLLRTIPTARTRAALSGTRKVRTEVTKMVAGFRLAMIGLALVVVPHVVHADTLAALRARLAGYPDDTVVSGVLAVSRDSTKGKGKHAKQSRAKIQLDVSARRGVSLHVPGSVLARAMHEMDAARANPELPSPTADLFASIGPLQAERMLDVASTLRLTLTNAKLVRTVPGQLDGTALREVQLLLPLSANKGDRSKIKKYTSHMTIWLDKDGVPVAYTLTTVTEVGWLFLDLNLDRTEAVRVVDHEGRLIATKYIVSERTSGLGQHRQSTTTYTLQLLPTRSTSARQPPIRSAAS